MIVVTVSIGTSGILLEIALGRAAFNGIKALVSLSFLTRVEQRLERPADQQQDRGVQRISFAFLGSTLPRRVKGRLHARQHAAPAHRDAERGDHTSEGSMSARPRARQGARVPTPPQRCTANALAICEAASPRSNHKVRSRHRNRDLVTFAGRPLRHVDAPRLAELSGPGA